MTSYCSCKEISILAIPHISPRQATFHDFIINCVSSLVENSAVFTIDTWLFQNKEMSHHTLPTEY